MSSAASRWLKQTSRVRYPSRARRRAFAEASIDLPLPAGPTTSSRRELTVLVEDPLLVACRFKQCRAIVLDATADQPVEPVFGSEQLID